MKQSIKLIVGIVLKVVCWPLTILPMKQRVLFISFDGEKFSCNPKYIFQEIQKDSDGLELVWAFRDPKGYSNLKSVRYPSLKWLVYVCTSRILISNNGFNFWLPKRKGQIRINTWHGGGAYKESDNQNNKSLAERNQDRLKAALDTHFISSCKKFTEEYLNNRTDFTGDILEIGTPRNDLLIKKDKRTEDQIREGLGISKNAFVVLYAPTWRENDKEIEQLDYSRIYKNLREKYEEVIILVRAHHIYQKSLNIDGIDGLLNVTDYEDMQELLLASDMLITDYSSSIWDMIHLGRPVLLFTPDLDDYRATRSFHVDIMLWGLPLLKTMDQMISYISTDSYLNLNNFEQHKQLFGSFEGGNASKKIADFIRMSTTYK